MRANFVAAPVSLPVVKLAASALAGVLRLAGQVALHVGRTLVDVALRGRVGRGLLQPGGRPGRAARARPAGGGRGTPARSRRAGCPSPPTASRRSRGTSRRTAASSSSWPCCMKASTTLRCVSLGTSSRTTAISQASAFASAVGRAARAAAARSRPEMVLSRRSSSSMRSSSARPARASPPSRVQRRSVSMTRPSITREPSSRPSRSSSAGVGVRRDGERARERELVVAARLGLVEQPADALLPGRAQLGPVGRCGEVVGGLGGVPGDPRGAERVGLHRDVAEHELRRSRWRSSRRRGSCPTPRPSTGRGPASRRAACSPATTVASERSSRRILA